MFPSTIRKVEVLPFLNQDEFDSFPDLDLESTVFMSFGTEFNSLEIASAACAVITACKRACEWKPLELKAYYRILEQYPSFKVSEYRTYDGFLILVSMGYAEIIEFEEKYYVLPKPDLVKTALEGRLEIVE